MSSCYRPLRLWRARFFFCPFSFRWPASRFSGAEISGFFVFLDEFLLLYVLRAFVGASALAAKKCTVKDCGCFAPVLLGWVIGNLCEVSDLELETVQEICSRFLCVLFFSKFKRTAMVFCSPIHASVRFGQPKEPRNREKRQFFL